MSNKKVYVIQRPDGLVKIGVSQNPEARRRSLELQGGFSATAMFTSALYTNAFQIESLAHEHFKNSRVRGEWFESDFSSVVACVTGLCEEKGETAPEEQPPKEPIEPFSVLASSGGALTKRERDILRTFGKVLPELSELEKEKLLSFGEGMAFIKGAY